MTSTPRELVHQTLEFRNPARVPRQLWMLVCAQLNHPKELAEIQEAYPPDIIHADGKLTQIAKSEGDPYRKGRHVDDWGCVFTNLQDGVVGEVREPLIRDWETDVPRVHIPREWLSITPDEINRACAATDRFVLAGCCPRPFEQLQFLRMSENLYMDLADPPDEMLAFMKQIHEFYCELLQAWARTDVDALMFMDDWGSQRSLLISPAMWRQYFKPMYRDYIQIAHSAGKKMFMHSDGHILSAMPDLVELGLDAVNSQLFCMGVENLAPFAGKITFWGEIDRQHLLPNGTTADIDRAVKLVHANLWKNGGCIAQCEFGAGARPENVRQVFTSWDKLLAPVG